MQRQNLPCVTHCESHEGFKTMLSRQWLLRRVRIGNAISMVLSSEKAQHNGEWFHPSPRNPAEVNARCFFGRHLAACARFRWRRSSSTATSNVGENKQEAHSVKSGSLEQKTVLNLCVNATGHPPLADKMQQLSKPRRAKSALCWPCKT